jgi:hypothetical protein
VGRFQDAYLIFGAYAPDDRFLPRRDASLEDPSQADVPPG